MNALDLLRTATQALTNSGIESAEHEAERIISHCLGIDRASMYRDNPALSEDTLIGIRTLFDRRTKREPLQYIIGYVEFHGLKIKVGPGVLVPRPETELLVEEAIRIIRSQQSNPPFSQEGEAGVTDSEMNVESTLRILDLCTGSGCIALALARAFPDAEVYGTDTSEVAIRYADENAGIHGVSNATFLRGSLFEPIKERFTVYRSLLTADLIISNPPYIRRGEIQKLQPEIRDWEPIEALDGGEDGCDYYRMIVPEARNYLKAYGYLMFEFGISQADTIQGIAEKTGYRNITLTKDYAGIERIMILKMD